MYAFCIRRLHVPPPLGSTEYERSPLRCVEVLCCAGGVPPPEFSLTAGRNDMSQAIGTSGSWQCARCNGHQKIDCMQPIWEQACASYQDIHTVDRVFLIR